MGSVVIPHLVTGWHVDQAIMSEEDRLVVIRFGRDWDPDCMRQDEVLYKIADRVKNFAVIYVCDLDQVPDFKQMYELYDTTTLMFFFRNKHMMCDFGTGNNNKLNWVLEDKQELIDIIETIYKGAKKGRGLVVSPKDYSTRSVAFVCDCTVEMTPPVPCTYWQALLKHNRQSHNPAHLSVPYSDCRLRTQAWKPDHSITLHLHRGAREVPLYIRSRQPLPTVRYSSAKPASPTGSKQGYSTYRS
nr:thioredoxin-like protein 4a [Quercus suber]